VKLTRSEAMKLRRYSARERENIARSLQYGCNWHGSLLSDGCAECDMIHFYRREVGREAHAK
jgi:hypothetical protein